VYAELVAAAAQRTAAAMARSDASVLVGRFGAIAR
jgi:hypothetical protein